MIVSNEFQAILRRMLLFTTIFRPSKKFDGEKNSVPRVRNFSIVRF